MAESRPERVVGLGVGLDRSVNPRGEVVLIRLLPAPDRGKVVVVPATVGAQHFVQFRGSR